MSHVPWLAAILALGTISPALAQTVPLPDVPAAIKPGDLKAYLMVPATGVQIYLCTKPEGGNWTWAFKAPEAELFNPGGVRLGKHYGGPTWEGSDSGKVVGAMRASADAPAANAIAWLWLDVKSREGSGALTQATGILRVNTVGGRPPAAGCDEGRAGSELRVPYTATYYFLK